MQVVEVDDNQSLLQMVHEEVVDDDHEVHDYQQQEPQVQQIHDEVVEVDEEVDLVVQVDHE